MSGFDIKDTAAYKVVDQMVSHMWPSASWEEKDLVCVYRLFSQRGFSWEGIMIGEPCQLKALEDAISDYMNYRDIIEAAQNLANT